MKPTTPTKTELRAEILRLREALNETNGLLAAMLYEPSPPSEIANQIYCNLAALANKYAQDEPRNVKGGSK